VTSNGIPILRCLPSAAILFLSCWILGSGAMRAAVTNRTQPPGPILAPAPGGTNVVPRLPLRGDVQRLEEIPDPWKRPIQVGFVALVAGAAALAWWRWIRRPPAVPAPIAPPDPAVVARGRIEAAREWISEPRRYAGEVSDAVRHYLEDRFGLKAPERTTEEFLMDLTRRPTLDPRHQGPLAAFLEQCDLVKFAGWRPGAQELDGLEAAAIWVVDEASPAGPNSAVEPVDGDGTEAPPKEAGRKGGTDAV
jgi:hypothetical protein